MTCARPRMALTLALTLALALAGVGQANRTQRLIFDAGYFLGLWQAQVALFGTPATEASQIGYANAVFASVEQVRDRLQPPFQSLDLQAVLDAIARYPERTERLSTDHRAIAVAQVHDLLRTRLSVAYLSTVGPYAAFTCDAAFVDVGYHLGRAEMGAFAGDAYTVSNARSMLLQAIRSGLAAATHLGCGFNFESVWAGLDVELARTAAEFGALVDPLRETADAAIGSLADEAPWTPLGDPRDARAEPPVQGEDAILGAWRYDSDTGTVVFQRAGDGFVGTLHDLAPIAVAFGGYEGQETLRVRYVGDGAYEGEVLKSDRGAFVWRAVRVVVGPDWLVVSDQFPGGNDYRANRLP